MTPVSHIQLRAIYFYLTDNFLLMDSELAADDNKRI
jgi:hypothetical protein